MTFPEDTAAGLLDAFLEEALRGHSRPIVAVRTPDGVTVRQARRGESLDGLLRRLGLEHARQRRRIGKVTFIESDKADAVSDGDVTEVA